MFSEDAFWSQTEQRGTCLIWTGKSRRHGRTLVGFWDVPGGQLAVHRVAYAYYTGATSLVGRVVQTCGNTLCCAFDHLRYQDPALPGSGVTAGTRSHRITDLAAYIDANVLRSRVQHSCWIWKGKAPVRIYLPAGRKYLKRAVYEHYRDALPAGAQLLTETCGATGDCFNPAHMTVRYRSTRESLSEVEQELIRIAYKRRDATIPEIAAIYETTPWVIRGIIRSARRRPRRTRSKSR